MNEVPVRDAATVMIVRDAAGGLEVLMVRRTTAAVFAGGAFVFPGGVLDAGDAEEAAGLVRGLSADDAAALVGSDLGLGFWLATVREAFEEAGVLLASGAAGTAALAVPPASARHAVHAGELAFGRLLRDVDAHVDAGAIDYVARWVTPPGSPRRFDTRFFLAAAPENQEPVHDGKETTEALWLRPRRVLERFSEGEISLMLPTIRNVQWLAGFASVAEARAATRDRAVETVAPFVRNTEDGGVVLVVGDDELPVNPEALWGARAAPRAGDAARAAPRAGDAARAAPGAGDGGSGGE